MMAAVMITPRDRRVSRPLTDGRVELRLVEDLPGRAVGPLVGRVRFVHVALALLVATGVLGGVVWLGHRLALPAEVRPAGAAGGTPALDGEVTSQPTRERLVSGEYVVQPGDTYWDLAEALGFDGDRRVLVDRLVELNGEELRAGLPLRVPSTP